MGRKISRPPQIFGVNWFRVDDSGNFIWPGYGENMRVLKWIAERVNGEAKGVESPLGWMPRYEDLYWNGLDFSKNQFDNLMNIDVELWKKEMQLHQELFVSLQDKLPKELSSIRESLLSKISIANK